jgi:hypothetical protein
VDKIYVKVIAEFDIDGRITPLELIWEDDRRFEITRITDVRRSASTKAGGTGYRYTVVIEGKERYIWLEDTVFNKTIGAKWFVESMDK